jgi:chemotaxis protein MotA
VADHHVVEFITDYLRMMVSGNLNSHEIESLMDSEIETHHQEAHRPGAALPAGRRPARYRGRRAGRGEHHGLGGPAPGVLGGMIASALVGTFLGILLAYGWWSRWPACWSRRSRTAQGAAVHQGTLLASMQGYNPPTAIEFGRKVLFSTERPGFLELEEHVKGKK